MFVCARCTGIYFGGLIAIASSLVMHTPFIINRFLILAILPLLFDIFITTVGIYNYSQALAFITGILFGTVLCLVILNELENIFKQNLIKRYE